MTFLKLREYLLTKSVSRMPTTLSTAINRTHGAIRSVDAGAFWDMRQTALDSWTRRTTLICLCALSGGAAETAGPANLNVAFLHVYIPSAPVERAQRPLAPL